jgi:hypothetical protein
MQTVWYTLTLGGRGAEASVSLPVRLDADDDEVYRVVAAAEDMLARLGAARTVREMEREEQLQQWRARATPLPPPDEEPDAGELPF